MQNMPNRDRTEGLPPPSPTPDELYLSYSLARVIKPYNCRISCPPSPKSDQKQTPDKQLELEESNAMFLESQEEWFKNIVPL